MALVGNERWEMRILVSVLLLISFSQGISEMSEALGILSAIIFILQMGKLRLRTGQGLPNLALDSMTSFIY